MSESLQFATPKWYRERRAAVAAIKAARSRQDTTTLIIPAAQHPLEDGLRPGPEHTKRLEMSVEIFHQITALGRSAMIHVSGNRHHDSRTNQTDEVALYDAAGRWLLDKGIPPEQLVGKEWIDQHLPQGAYSGAAEIRVAAAGYAADSQFGDVTYICSPGQVVRAKTYGLAYGLPLEVASPEVGDVQQFHDRGLQTLALNALTRTVDPYGQRILERLTRDRIPADGNIDTLPGRLAAYTELPWYQAATE